MNGETHAGRFCSYLRTLSEDKAAMSALKRGAAHQPGEYPPQFRYIVPFIPEKSSELPYFLTATLFGIHPQDASSGSFGTAFKRIYLDTGSDSIELRFNALLQAREEDLPYHLRNAVSLLASRDISVNYTELFDAIRNWSHPDKFVQKRWAKDFWRPDFANDTNNES
ncbi:MAG: CRISPR-associated protein Cse2 [Ignavibacteriaceae bacterium]|nr:CRISPR-associated protein Cse2 [Ignavibacteriaceae bacterium]MCK6614399.1 type I-E CRISPR-associated protein Cse2/CasB [Ignavibacteriaceae bacterium]